MYYNCLNCKRDLPEGDMCSDCAKFLRPQTSPAVIVEEPLQQKVQNIVKKAIKVVKKTVKAKK